VRRQRVLGAALAMSTAAFAARATRFGKWDTDRDDLLSKDEFQSGMPGRGLFNEWDTNNDGKLDRGEYDTVGWGPDHYVNWDDDKASALSEDETFGGAFFRPRQQPTRPLGRR
jgi:hypothetical protein